MNPFIERTIQWGVLHFKMTYNFKNYANITFVDVKYNLCDFFVYLINKHCPIQPGMYHLYYHAQILNLFFWPVSNKYSVSLLLLYFIGPVLCQRYRVQ